MGTEIDELAHVEQEVRFGSLVIHMARVLFFCAYVGRNYGPLQSWRYTRTRAQEYVRAKQVFLSQRLQ